MYIYFMQPCSLQMWIPIGMCFAVLYIKILRFTVNIRARYIGIASKVSWVLQRGKHHDMRIFGTRFQHLPLLRCNSYISNSAFLFINLLELTFFLSVSLFAIIALEVWIR